MYLARKDYFPAVTQDNQRPRDFYEHLATGEFFLTDDSTALLTDDDLAKYSHLVHKADQKEIKAFVHHKVFKLADRRRLPKNTNLVDCIWIRKWAVKHQEVKSRMCARGCFDRQKHVIEKHSSTATRLSQRMVISLGLCDDIIYSPSQSDVVDTESFDISTAFLQGLDFTKLREQSRDLGYEYRHAREVHIEPPENIWRHLRSIPEAKDLHIDDNRRWSFVLQCLRAMYGFADAPLMFQLALIKYLKETTGAISSVFDDNYLYWLENINGEKRLTLVMTAHVDDLQTTGSKSRRDWIYKHLERRFGKLKRQQMPYTHAGIQLDRLSSDCVRLHQDQFCSKLELYKISKERTKQSEEPCTPEEVFEFRSLTCSALWACQTRMEEQYPVVSLQSYLQKPLVKHLLAINTVVKRLRKTGDNFGIYFWRLKPPLHILTISDASSANKTSDRASEGLILALAEDRLPQINSDKKDFLSEEDTALLGGRMHILAATSQKSKRISHSTSHAETLAAAKAIPIGQLGALRLAEPELCAHHGHRQVRLAPLQLLDIQDKSQCPIPHDHVIDCMDLWELACGCKGIPQDKSQRLGVLHIREERRQLRLRRLYHLPTAFMLADMLTKREGADSKTLLQLASSGYWNVGGHARVRQGFGIATASSTADSFRTPSSTDFAQKTHHTNLVLASRRTSDERTMLDTMD